MSKATKQPRRAAAPDDRPPAPWGNLPLAELVIFAGIVSLLIGLIGANPTMLIVGVALAGLGGLEVAIREHFAGYRSHTTLLSGAAFVLTTGVVLYLAGQVAVALALGAAAFAAAFYLARRAFQRASGGLSYRIGGMRG